MQQTVKQPETEQVAAGQPVGAKTPYQPPTVEVMKIDQVVRGSSGTTFDGFTSLQP